MSHNNVGGVIAGQAPHNSSNVGVVTVGQVGHNSSNININIRPTHFKIDHGNQPSYYYDSHNDNTIDNNNT